MVRNELTIPCKRHWRRPHVSDTPAEGQGTGSRGSPGPSESESEEEEEEECSGSAAVVTPLFEWCDTRARVAVIEHSAKSLTLIAARRSDDVSVLTENFRYS